MKEILEAIIKSLVQDRDSISIKETTNEKAVNYEVKVAATDMGRVIGRQGRVAKAIRSIMKAMAAKEHKRINIEFID